MSSTVQTRDRAFTRGLNSCDSPIKARCDPIDKARAAIENFHFSGEYRSETDCIGDKIKDEWSQEEEDIFWKQIETLREKNIVCSKAYRNHERACRTSGTSISFSSDPFFIDEDTASTDLLEDCSSKSSPSGYSQKSFHSQAA